MSFALSKWPHLHRTYLVTVRNQNFIAVLIFCHDQIKSIYSTFFIVISKNNYFSMKNGQKTHSCGTITTQVCNSKKENNDVLPPSSPKGTMDRQKEFHSIHSVLIQGYSNSPDSNNAVLEIMWFPICNNLSIMYSLTEYASWKHSYELIEFSSETVGTIATTAPPVTPPLFIEMIVLKEIQKFWTKFNQILLGIPNQPTGVRMYCVVCVHENSFSRYSAVLK